MMFVLLKKRRVFSALFLFVALAYSISASHADPLRSSDLCSATEALELAKIERVVDGDTIHLEDGRKVRLIGLDTPELDHKKGLHEPYALAAKNFLTEHLDHYVYIQKSKSDRDRYGRYLYYLFDKDRISLTSQLLSEGLGYRIAVSPNLAYQDCFIASENAARRAHKGLWQQPLQWQPKAGFAISRVNITSVTQNRGGWWLETNQDLVINLPANTSHYWPAQKVFYLEGKAVEVRGWQHQRKSRHSNFASWVLSVRHPNDLSEPFVQR
ncbi:thermonuclease family protein [Marinomonas algarum]|uniref:Thermonuclease family protein n=1 Tax=Marinomonas algarum TaxID=2883105 RepID=A0A9X1LDB0_9GAMM|nr:thermonuclease family protein [Marinomonas algarum]MCB5162312.1 thermonuclease family protein [Marinomonas algarum]